MQSVCLSGETAAQEWLRNMMVEGAPAEAMRAWILAPVSAPPRGSFNRGRIVCNCLDVAETEIRAMLAEGAGLPQLQERLKCGTECGSCVPELKRMCNRQDSGSGLRIRTKDPSQSMQTTLRQAPTPGGCLPRSRRHS